MRSSTRSSAKAAVDTHAMLPPVGPRTTSASSSPIASSKRSTLTNLKASRKPAEVPSHVPPSAGKSALDPTLEAAASAFPDFAPEQLPLPFVPLGYSDAHQPVFNPSLARGSTGAYDLMQLGVGSFQHFEHAAPNGGPHGSADSSPRRGGGGGGGGAGQQVGNGPPGQMIIDHVHGHGTLAYELGMGGSGGSGSGLKSVNASASTSGASSPATYDDHEHGGGRSFPGGPGQGGRQQQGGLLLLQRDMASILYLDVQQSSSLIYDLIGVLNQNAECFDRSLAPELQSEEAKEKLRQLADFITISIPVVQKVAPSWPNLGLWLMTKAFDCWIGHLT